MIALLLGILAFVAFRSGGLAVAAFVTFEVSHKIIGDYLSDVLYYWTAGVFNVATMAIISAFAKPSRLAEGILAVSCGALFLNSYGWWIWFNRQPPESYNTAFILLYVLAILIILRGDDEKRDSSSNRAVFFPVARRKSVATGGALSKEGRT